MKNLILLALLLTGKVQAQTTKYNIRQIDSIVNSIDRMQLASKGGGMQAGTVKNSTWFFYDSTTSELRKVVQTIAVDTFRLEMVFYYAGKQFHKFHFEGNAEDGGADKGAIYYAGTRVLRNDLKGKIDTNSNQLRGQSFVALFDELMQSGFSGEELQKKLILSGFQ